LGFDFSFTTPLMNHGVVKQLDSDNLLPLRTDMGPSSCHDVILSCWQDELSNNGSNHLCLEHSVVHLDGHISAWV